VRYERCTIMRGFHTPAVRIVTTDSQRAFQDLSRHRRTKLARAAHTTLLKADQWGRGDAVGAEVATALDSGVKSLSAPKKK
jgi:hypothetical protein